MNKYIFLLLLPLSCVSTTNTFIVNGELLPQKIYTKCGSYFYSPIIGVLKEHGIKTSKTPVYLFGIKFNEDTAKLISIDSLRIVSFKKNIKINLIKIQQHDKMVDDSTYFWIPTIYGGYFGVLKSDSFDVSFVIKSDNLVCTDKKSFIIIPTKATDKQIENNLINLNK